MYLEKKTISSPRMDVRVLLIFPFLLIHSLGRPFQYNDSSACTSSHTFVVNLFFLLYTPKKKEKMITLILVCVKILKNEKSIM